MASDCAARRLAHLSREIGADARQCSEVDAARQQDTDVFGQRADRPGRISVGPNPERIRVFDVEEVGDFVEDRNDPVVGHARARYHGGGSFLRDDFRLFGGFSHALTPADMRRDTQDTR